MRKTTRKIKTTTKRIVKPPSQAMAISLIALILIVGAPAIVSMIDDSYDSTFEDHTPINFDKYETFAISNFRLAEEAFTDYEKLISDNSVVITFLEDTSVGSKMTFMMNNLDPKDFVTSSKIVMASNADVHKYSSFAIKIGDVTVSDVRFLAVTDDDDNVINYEAVLSSYDRAMLQSDNAVLNIYIRVDEAELYNEFEFYSVNEVFVPYSDIIIGATGVILILTALFATPYFGLGGITAKPRRK